MTVSDLLDQITFDSGDAGSEYRTAARRWLNLTRAYIADQAMWKSALDPTPTITTAAATTSGLYSLTGYEFVASSTIYDETNETVLTMDSLARLSEIDPGKETTGKPSHWADAGMDSSGDRQLYIWPVPDDTYTIRYNGYKRLTGLTANDDNDTEDPFFGPIMPWSACFTAGLRYFHDLNNNDDINAVMRSQIAFDKQITRKKTQNRVNSVGPIPMSVIKAQILAPTGRFDPSHFSNR